MTLAIVITAVTDSSTVTHEVMVGPAAGNGLNMTVYIEGNTTSRPVLGVIGFGDVDQHDTVIFINSSKTNGGGFPGNTLLAAWLPGPIRLWCVCLLV